MPKDEVTKNIERELEFSQIKGKVKVEKIVGEKRSDWNRIYVRCYFILEEEGDFENVFNRCLSVLWGIFFTEKEINDIKFGKETVLGYKEGGVYREKGEVTGEYLPYNVTASIGFDLLDQNFNDEVLNRIKNICDEIVEI